MRQAKFGENIEIPEFLLAIPRVTGRRVRDLKRIWARKDEWKDEVEKAQRGAGYGASIRGKGVRVCGSAVSDQI